MGLLRFPSIEEWIERVTDAVILFAEHLVRVYRWLSDAVRDY